MDFPESAPDFPEDLAHGDLRTTLPQPPTLQSGTWSRREWPRRISNELGTGGFRQSESPEHPQASCGPYLGE